MESRAISSGMLGSGARTQEAMRQSPARADWPANDHRLEAGNAVWVAWQCSTAFILVAREVRGQKGYPLELARNEQNSQACSPTF